MKHQLLNAKALASLPDGEHHDGRGLYLIVNGSSRRWSQRLTLGGKRVKRGLGTLANVTLAQARKKSADMRTAAAQGEDARKPTVKQPTFEAVMVETVEARKNAKSLKAGTVRQWHMEMGKHAAPLMPRPVDTITTAEIIAVLEAPGLPINAHRRIRQRINLVMARARAMGYRADNPAGENLDAASPAPVQRADSHYAALPYANVAQAFAGIRAGRAYRSTKLAILFAILTAARGGEARGAKWEEIDMDTATWTVPGARMKMGKEHRVPLSSGALAVLHEAREAFGDSGYIFPNKNGEALGGSFARAIQRMGIATTMHGFRSSFRDWLAETGVGREIAESALAHAKPSAVIGAYERTDFFDQRRAIMERWAGYVVA